MVSAPICRSGGRGFVFASLFAFFINWPRLPGRSVKLGFQKRKRSWEVETTDVISTRPHRSPSADRSIKNMRAGIIYQMLLKTLVVKTHSGYTSCIFFFQIFKALSYNITLSLWIRGSTRAFNFAWRSGGHGSIQSELGTSKRPIEVKAVGVILTTSRNEYRQFIYYNKGLAKYTE